MIDFIWLIPFILLLAALINGLGVKRLGRYAGHIAWVSMALVCLISFATLFQSFGLIAEGNAHGHPWHGKTIVLWNWFSIPNLFGTARSLNIEMAFHVDQLTCIYLAFVSFVGLLVFIYATGYMKEKHNGHLELDPGYARFFSYLCLFAASMMVLVLGDNLVVMFIGWEGVGLCSYLLIGYYFDRPFSEILSCSDAGRKAFVMNRIGDAGMIVGMGILFWGLGSLNFQELNAIIESGKMLDGVTDIPKGFLYGGGLITLATLAMFFGATGKSAQIPLFTWLPDAMAGPTPVSALIHAATMVTAGIYMVARLNVLYFMAPKTMAIIAIIGAVTAFAAATMGLTQRGIKKILAYSTVSQLGYMFLGLGVGAMAAGIFHVFTHAFFKACLFLCAGSVIHALHHEEDVFKMGGLRKYMPHTAITYGIATLAIAGIPPLSGFFSKDEILYSAFVNAHGGIPVLWIIGVITAVMTAIYMGRSYFLAFEGEERIDPHAKEHLHESPKNITGPLWILAIGAIVVGLLNIPPFLSEHGARFHHYLSPVVDRGAEIVAVRQLGLDATAIDHAAGHTVSGPLVAAGATVEELEGEHSKSLEAGLALLSALLAAAGLGIAWVLFGTGITDRARSLAKGLRPLWSTSYNCWWWDDFYRRAFQNGTWNASLGAWLFDMKVVDGTVNGAGRLSRWFGRNLRQLQSGQVQVYGLMMVLGVTLFLLYFLLGVRTFQDAGAPPPQDGSAGPAVVQPVDSSQLSSAAIPSTVELADLGMEENRD